jgi:hypothetical protein
MHYERVLAVELDWDVFAGNKRRSNSDAAPLKAVASEDKCVSQTARRNEKARPQAKLGQRLPQMLPIALS